MENNIASYDVLIVGSGIVGATTALALAKKTSLRIALLDAKKISSDWQVDQHDYRVSAISLASQRIFHHLDVWSAMQAKRVSPYRHMHVWDASAEGALEFDCRSIHLPELGHIVEDAVMRSSLIEKFSQFPHLEMLAPRQLVSLHEASDHIDVVTDDGQRLRARLVIGADGGNSWVRERANIEMSQWDYAHRAIVTTVNTELSHQSTAWQCFLPEEATRLLALDQEAFEHALTQVFGGKLGAISAPLPRFSFQLQMRHVKKYVKPHLVLVGDAAHTIHPMAGQGVNLGLLDAASLVDVIVEAIAKKRDFASLAVLRRYERWRKADNAMMLGFVEVIKALFASEAQFVMRLRCAGMRMTNKIDFMRNFFANYASGNRDDMPALASYQLSE
jgi:2-octaprenylphenol hydroxylase